jgi:hypothetical protein
VADRAKSGWLGRGRAMECVERKSKKKRKKEKEKKIRKRNGKIRKMKKEKKNCLIFFRYCDSQFILTIEDENRRW